MVRRADARRVEGHAGGVHLDRGPREPVREVRVDRYNLNDRGYISSVHPLELWTVNYLRDHPLASVDQIEKASSDVRLRLIRGSSKLVFTPLRTAA